MGFYRLVDGEVEVGPNFVHAPGYSLSKHDADKTNLPDGWMWFETQKGADLYFNLPLEGWTPEKIRKLKQMKDKDVLALMQEVTGDVTSLVARTINDTLDKKASKKDK